MLSSANFSSMLDSDCIAISVSVSGQTKAVINAIKSTKEQGVPVICRPSNRNLQLATLSGLVLASSGSGKNIVEAQNEAHFSQFLPANLLCAYESKNG